jgi:hypothetical protein
MSGYNIQTIRDVLLKHPDGLTLREMNSITGITIESLANSLKRCYGCYVSHWRQARPDHKFVAQVWKCVPVPENAQKPPASRTPEDIKAYQAEYRFKMQTKTLEKRMKRAAEKYEKERLAAREAKKKPKPVLTSTGLTTIRGPWPVWN